jgi:NAD+ synthase (glutamine-hydrolysing)
VELDEKGVDMICQEIFTLAELWKVERMGPVQMFERVLGDCRHQKSLQEIAVLVKRLHHFDAINRQKMTTMISAYHAAEYSAEDPSLILYLEFSDNCTCERINSLLTDIEDKVRSEERKDSVLQS